MAGRSDRVLLAGLAIALIVLVAGRAAEMPLRPLVVFTRSVEDQSGLALVPALVILAIAVLIQQQGKRREAKADAAASEVQAVQAQAHAAELERLVGFGRSLNRSLDMDAIREAVVRDLPELAGTSAAWVLIRVNDGWRPLLDAEGDGSALAAETRRARERIADGTLEPGGAIGMAPVAVDGHLCIPLTAGGFSVGVLAVPQTAGPFSDAQQRMLAAAAALLGASVSNAQLFREVRESSVRDGLTGCFNRTHAVEVIATELRRTRRLQLPLSLIMFDLDRFKDINDQYGHLCGDAVMAAVGARMRSVLRGSDVKSRYGGDEFLVLLPETPLEGAMRVADTLRRKLAEMPIEWSGHTLHVTASFGVTTALPSETDVQTLIGRADGALYRAKAHGRDCVRPTTESAFA